ncbi:RNA polymerase sigma factor [Amnibacterium endophyticum]|uniref:RNA polymerase sigma factor n=1 Tax=Amnibacterium endophyticum TaxID=2109337 RepID=A0ABW4LBQ2_9MICO
MEPDDAEVWSRAVSGDGESFGVVFDRHRDRVRRHLTRLLDTPQDVEDAVAVVFLEAWRRRSSVRLVQGSVLPWLLVTATYTANNARRSARRYRALLDRLPPPEPAVDDTSLLEESDVVAALRRLSEADQQILTLCVLEEWSERDAAEALHVRPGTVKSRLHRAKRRLVKQFERLTAVGGEEVRHGV